MPFSLGAMDTLFTLFKSIGYSWLEILFADFKFNWYRNSACYYTFDPLGTVARLYKRLTVKGCFHPSAVTCDLVYLSVHLFHLLIPALPLEHQGMLSGA